MLMSCYVAWHEACMCRSAAGVLCFNNNGSGVAGETYGIAARVEASNDDVS